MKNILSLVIALVLMSSVTAQSSRFGLKTGLNIATLTNINEDDSPKLNLHTGCFTEFSVTSRFFVQPELLLSIKGISQRKMDANKDIRISYISVPIVAKYYVKGGLCVEAGPYIAAKLRAYEYRLKNKKDLSDVVSALDNGVILGVNYMLQNSLNFGVRCSMGLSDVFDDNRPENSKNVVTQIGVGYIF